MKRCVNCRTEYSFPGVNRFGSSVRQPHTNKLLKAHRIIIARKVAFANTLSGLIQIVDGDFPEREQINLIVAYRHSKTEVTFLLYVNLEIDRESVEFMDRLVQKKRIRREGVDKRFGGCADLYHCFLGGVFFELGFITEVEDIVGSVRRKAKVNGHDIR
jgi:hypothetical protein